MDDLNALDADLEHMANAIVQLYKQIADYQAGKYEHFPFDADRTIFPIVVTLEDWHIFLETARRVRELVSKKLIQVNISPGILEEMPYSVWWIDDLEAGMAIMCQTGIRSFLEGKIRDPEMNRWEWRPYIMEKFRGLFSRQDLFRADYEALFQKVIRDATMVVDVNPTPPPPP